MFKRLCTECGFKGSENEAINLCFYDNFQPLWAKDNWSKSNKIHQK